MSTLRRCMALGLCLTTGCSFTFVETVPDNPHQLRYFDCTSTPGLPVADGVIAVSNTVNAVTVFTQSKEEYEAENEGASRDVVGGISIGVAAIMVASGIYGLIQTETCRSAKSELRERLLAPQRDQQKLVPPAPSSPQSPPAQGSEATPAPQPPAATTPAPSDAQRIPVPQTPPQPTWIEPAPEVGAPPGPPAPPPPPAAPPP